MENRQFSMHEVMIIVGTTVYITLGITLLAILLPVWGRFPDTLTFLAWYIRVYTWLLPLPVLALWAMRQRRKRHVFLEANDDGETN